MPRPVMRDIAQSDRVGHMTIKTAEAATDTSPDTMIVLLFPLKKASHSGSDVSLKRLKLQAPMRPDRIPMKVPSG